MNELKNMYAEPGRSIPDGWMETTLGEVINISSGKSRPKNSGDFPVYGGNGILDYADNYNYENKTIIIGRVGAYCGCVYYENNKFWLSDNALGIKSNIKSNIKFLYYFLIYQNLNKKSIGGAQPLLTQGILNQIEIVIPTDTIEQKSIASILTSFDNKIELLQAQNKTLEETAQTIFAEWFGKYQIDDELPEGWRVGKISEIIDVRDGTHDSPKQSEIGMPLITSRHIVKNTLDFNNAYLISEKDFNDINKRSLVEKNDILFSMIGTLGLTYLEQSENINYAIKNVGLFKTSKNTDWIYYTYLWLTSSLGKDFIKNYKSGSTQEYIALGSLRSILFIIPSNKFLQNFNSLMKSFFDKIKTNAEQIQTLTKTRDELLPRLMSGEVRVSEL